MATKQKHTLLVTKSFRIKAKDGSMITLESGYRLQGKCKTYVKDSDEGKIEVMDILAEKDEDKIKETIQLVEIPCSCIKWED